MSVVRYIARNTASQQAQLLAVVVGGVVLNLIPIHLLRVVLDTAIPQRDVRTLLWIGGLLAGVVLAQGATTYLRMMLAEKMRRLFVVALRNELFAHVLRLPAEFFARTSVGTLTNRVQLDVGRLSMAVPEIFVAPLVSGVTVAFFAVYLFSMNPLLALAAIAPLPLAAALVPRINARLGECRRRYTKQVASYVSGMQEAFAAHSEIQAHATFGWEQARVARLEADFLDTRQREEHYDSALAMLSDVSRGLGPVLVYAYGGWLAIAGKLSIGEIVAFSAALGGLSLSVDKLLKYPPVLRNARDRFDEIQRFLRLPAFVTTGPHSDVRPAAVPVATSRVSYSHGGRSSTLRDVSLDVRPGERIALVGRSGCGKSTLLSLIGGRLSPDAGTITVGGADPVHTNLSASVGFVAQHSTLFSTTLRTNLLYALLRRPTGDVRDPLSFVDARAWGDSAPTAEQVDDRLLDACSRVGLGDDLIELGLEARIDETTAGGLLDARQEVRARLSDVAGVEHFEPDRYLGVASVAENLLFAPDPAPQALTDEVVAGWIAIARRPDVALLEPLLRLGHEEVVRDLDFLRSTAERNPDLLARFGVDADDLAERARLAAHIGDFDGTAPDEPTRAELVRRALRAKGVSAALSDRIVRARPAFAPLATLPTYHPDRWHAHLTIRENLVFGRIDPEDLGAARRVTSAVGSVVRAEGRLRSVMRWSLDFHVGERGSRLSGGQRQKVSIARVVLKAPRLLLLDEATASLDDRSAATVDELIAAGSSDRTTIAITHRTGSLGRFDRVVVLDAGQVVEEGPVAELERRDGAYMRLRNALAEG